MNLSLIYNNNLKNFLQYGGKKSQSNKKLIIIGVVVLVIFIGIGIGIGIYYYSKKSPTTPTALTTTTTPTKTGTTIPTGPVTINIPTATNATNATNATIILTYGFIENYIDRLYIKYNNILQKVITRNGGSINMNTQLLDPEKEKICFDYIVILNGRSSSFKYYSYITLLFICSSDESSIYTFNISKPSKSIIDITYKNIPDVISVLNNIKYDINDEIGSKMPKTINIVKDENIIVTAINPPYYIISDQEINNLTFTIFTNIYVPILIFNSTVNITVKFLKDFK